MKILILVLSYDKHPYDELMKAQIETWDSVHEPGVEVMYYYGGLQNIAPSDLMVIRNYHYSSRVVLNSTDSYYFMAGKFKSALEVIKSSEFDIIFRTNSSSYVNKKQLVKFANTLPKTGLYSGWEIQGNAGYNVVSGAGFFLSPDTAEILRLKIDPEFEREEDVYCAQLLHENGIKIIDDKSRVDVNVVNNNTPLSAYHYRLKGTHGNRLIDVENMRLLHKKILSNG